MPPNGAANFRPPRHRPSACAARNWRRAPQPGWRNADVTAETLEAALKVGKRRNCRWWTPPKLPPRDAKGPARLGDARAPKIDRIACPWLIRRFVDPNAVFLFVAPSEVVASANDSTPHRSISRTCSGATAVNAVPST